MTEIVQPRRRRQAVAFDLLFLSLLVVVTGPAALGTAWLASSLPLPALVRWGLAPIFALAFLVQLVAMAFLVRLCLPRLEPGTHAFPQSRGALAWLLHHALSRVLALPLWSNLLMAFSVTRFLALRARGARLPLDIDAALDIYVGDAPLVEIGPGALLGGTCDITGHSLEEGRLVLGRVQIGAGAQVMARAAVTSGCRLAPGAVLGPASALMPDCVLGERAHVGMGCLLMVGARVEADAVLGHQVTLESEVVVGEGAVVLSGARVPRGTKIAAGGRWPQPMPSTEIRSEASASDLLPLLSQWIAEIVDAPMPALSAETDIVKDAGLDSLALTQLAARVRQRFHVQMRAVEFSNDLRLGRLAALVAERIAAAGK